MVCTSPNAKVHGVLAVTDEGWEEVQCNNKYLCYPPCEPPSFTVHVHSSCSCANALQCADVMLTLLHSCIKSDGSYTHTNTSSAFLRVRSYSVRRTHTDTVREARPLKHACIYAKRENSRAPWCTNTNGGDHQTLCTKSSLVPDCSCNVGKRGVVSKVSDATCK